MSFFGKKNPVSARFDPQPPMGSPESMRATGVYLDLINGLKGHIKSLEGSLRLWQMIAVVVIIGFVISLPMRKRVPYILEVDSASGRITMSDRNAEELKFNDESSKYFLRVWLARLVTINASTLKEGLPSAMRWARGAAVNEMDEWVDKTDRTVERITKDPTITRELFGRPTVAFNEEKTSAFIDFVWLEKVNGIERERKRKLLTVDFGTVPPKTEEERHDNPIGLAISHFTINDQFTK